MHMMHTQINDLIIANLFIFPHTFSLDQEHFSGRNRVSSGEHCRKGYHRVKMNTERNKSVYGIIIVF